MTRSLEHRLLDTLVGKVFDSPGYLRAKGFTSCLCDETWMKMNSSPDELEEYEYVRRSYVEEVLYSADPAEILMSDPGDYTWRTLTIAEKVQSRYRDYGAVEDLFSDPAKRHLIYLSRAEQRLRMALERANSSAVAASDERIRLYQEQRELEKRAHHADVSDLKSRLGHFRAVEIEDAFISLLRTRIDGVLPQEHYPESPEGKAVLIPFAGDWVKVVVTASCDVRQECSGRIFVDTYISDGLVFLSRALPMKFDPYKHFVGDSELALCLLAWVEILSFIARPC